MDKDRNELCIFFLRLFFFLFKFVIKLSSHFHDRLKKLIMLTTAHSHFLLYIHINTKVNLVLQGLRC